jgi:hypothetical protein
MLSCPVLEPDEAGRGGFASGGRRPEAAASWTIQWRHDRDRRDRSPVFGPFSRADDAEDTAMSREQPPSPTLFVAVGQAPKKARTPFPGRCRPGLR